MMRSTPINALRRDEVQDPQTRDMVDGIVNELEYTGGGGGLPGGGGGFPGGEQQYMEPMHGSPQMMDYGGPSEHGGGYGSEFDGANGLAPGDPRGGQQFPGDGQMMMNRGQGYPQMMPEHDMERQMMMSGGQHTSEPHPHVKSNGNGNGNIGIVGTITDMVTSNSKEPLLAAALFLVMSNDTVSMMLSRYIPYAQSPMMGLLIRALLVAVLFFLVKNFVLNH